MLIRQPPLLVHTTPTLPMTQPHPAKKTPLPTPPQLVNPPFPTPTPKPFKNRKVPGIHLLSSLGRIGGGGVNVPNK